MFRKFFIFITLLALSCSAFSEDSYLGIFIQGKKIGYAVSGSSEAELGGRKVQKFTSKTVMNLGMLGAALSSVIEQTSWTTKEGKPLLMKFATTSAGRSQKVEANFLADGVRLAIDNNGSLSQKTVPIPKDAPIVDDAINAFLDGGAAPGASATFYVLDPTTAGFVKNVAKLVGKETIQIDGKEVQAIKATITEPRMSMTIFISGKGDLLRAEAMGGIELRPLSREEAMAQSDSGADADLAELTKIPVEPPLGNASALKSATYRFSGADLLRAPSDPSQSIRKEGSDWIVRVAPIVPQAGSKCSIEQAASQQPKWLAPSLNIPTTDPSLRTQARTIVKKEKSAVVAARSIGAYVQRSMRPNAGIGVLRDAREVFKTKEGVCRDYAILTASLIRSAGIPARLASGLVYDSGAFYYHAWVESWDGKNWYGIDSTRADLRVTPGHVKLAHGSVEDAFLFTFLDRAKVRLIDKSPKQEGN